MKNKVTFLVVVETNIDDYPEDQSTEIYKGEFYEKLDGFILGGELRQRVLSDVVMYANTVHEDWGCTSS